MESEEFKATLTAFERWVQKKSAGSYKSACSLIEKFFCHLESIGITEASKITRKYIEDFIELEKARSGQQEQVPVVLRDFLSWLRIVKIKEEYAKKEGK